MKIRAGVLCDYAEVREGLLTIVSGGITRLWRAQTPAPMAVFLALQLEVDPEERPFPHQLDVLIKAPSGKEAGKVTGAFQVNPGADMEPDECAFFNVPIDLRMIAVDEAGWYQLTTSVDGGEPFLLRVRVGPPPAPTPDAGIRIASHGERMH